VNIKRGTIHRDIPVTPSEKLQAVRFAEWFSARTETQHRITDGPDPPDALMQSNGRQTWLEVTDIYLSNEQARFLNSPGGQIFEFNGSPDEPLFRLVSQLNRKLSMKSYRPIFEKYGKGFLLLTSKDFVFRRCQLGSR